MDRFVIIAGTEKAGTTSIYQYLADSGFFNISKTKETDYFRRSGALSTEEYKSLFEKNADREFFLEASPGYLSESQIAAPNIGQLIADSCFLIFCLRSPLDRLKSSFLFHKSRLYIPKEMSFDDYFLACLNYEAGSKQTHGLSEWCLSVPDAGKYHKHLSDFYDSVGSEHIKVVSYDDFSKEPASIIKSICSNLGLDSGFYDEYDFGRSNVTQSHNFDGIQKMALKVNNLLEFFWTKNPKYKRAALKLYYAVNGKGKESLEFSEETLLSIYNYYQEDISRLAASEILPISVTDRWLEQMSAEDRVVEKASSF